MYAGSEQDTLDKNIKSFHIIRLRSFNVVLCHNSNQHKLIYILLIFARCMHMVKISRDRNFMEKLFAHLNTSDLTVQTNDYLLSS